MAPGRRAIALGAPYNECRNPSFELGTWNWYTTYPGSGPSVYSVIEVTEDWSGPRGGASLRWRAKADSGTLGFYSTKVIFYGIEEPVPVAPGETLAVSFWVKFESYVGPADSGQIYGQILYFNAAGAQTGSSTFLFNRLDDGTPPSAVDGSVALIGGTPAATSAPAGTVSAGVVIYLSLTGYAERVLLVDDVMISSHVAPGTAALTPFTGSDPGKGWEGEMGLSRSGTGTAFGDPFDLAPRAAEMLDSIPPVFREDPDVRAIIYAQGREAERQEEQMNDLLVQLDPVTATEQGLAWFETLLRSAVSPAATVAQRRATVKNRMSRVAGEPAGSGWETAVGEILGVLGTSWDYAEYVPARDSNINMIHNPKPVTNGVGTMTWWTSSYSAAGTTATVAGSAGAPFVSGGLQTSVDTTGVGGGHTGDVWTAARSGLMSPPFAFAFDFPDTRSPWFGFRCLYRVDIAQVFDNLSLWAQWTTLSNVVRGTSQVWLSPNSPSADAASGSPVRTVEARFQAPTNLSLDTRQLRVYFLSNVNANGSVKGQITWGNFVLMPLRSFDEEIPAYFDGDSPGYEWSGGSAAANDAQSESRSALAPLTIQIRVPYADPGAAGDAKIEAVRDLTASHLDLEVLYGETI